MLFLQDEDLQLWIQKTVQPSWRERDFVWEARRYFESDMPVVLAVGALRGLGKTVGLLQALPDVSDAVYICAQSDSAEALPEQLLRCPKKYFILDEYTWFQDRDTLDRVLYTLVQNGHRVAITGTESMTLELLNYGALIHRVYMVHCNLFTYAEYCRIYQQTPSHASCMAYLQTGGLFQAYALTGYEEMRVYIQEAIVKSLVVYMCSVDEPKATAVVYAILYQCVWPTPTENALSLRAFYELFGVDEIAYSLSDFSRVVHILQKIEFLVTVEDVHACESTACRYYIVNASMTRLLFQAVYGQQAPERYLDKLFEAATVVHFRHYLKNPRDRIYFLSKAQEIVFMISETPQLSQSVYYFTPQMRSTLGLKPAASILSDEIGQYFPHANVGGRYVIYTGEEYYAYLQGHALIFAPLGSALLENYASFDAQTDALIRQGRVYPATPDDPQYAR